MAPSAQINNIFLESTPSSCNKLFNYIQIASTSSIISQNICSTSINKFEIDQFTSTMSCNLVWIALYNLIVHSLAVMQLELWPQSAQINYIFLESTPSSCDKPFNYIQIASTSSIISQNICSTSINKFEIDQFTSTMSSNQV